MKIKQSEKQVWVLQGYYHVRRVLEELDYSTVYFATALERKTEEYAMKEIELHSDNKEGLQKALRYFEKIILGYSDIYYPYLANIKDFFFEDGCEYIVMEFVPGRRLQEIMDVRTEPFSELDVTDIGIMIASALSYLHTREKPLYFADLFPSNIIITPKGALQLTDYGLGKILARRPPDSPLRGTAGYAPLEQYGSKAVIDEKTDIYALGVVMHQLLTMRHPSSFEGRLPPVRQLNPSASERLTEIIYKATELNRNSRYKSARQFLYELSGIKEEKPRKSQMQMWLKRVLNRRRFEI